MSQASRVSNFTACGELGSDEAIEKIFAQRRRTGGRLEYHCDLRGGSEPRWLAAAALDAASLSAWEIVRATTLRADQEKRKRDARKRKRDEEAAMIVHTFKETAIGKLVLSQKINTNVSAGPNRKSDCENALKRMRSDGFKLYEIRSSSLDQQTSDAVTAGQAIGALADEYDFIGQHSFTTASFRSGGKTPPQPTFERIIRVEGDVPANAKTNTYYVKQVKEVVPLGAAVCTHADSTPKEAINTIERHAITARNNRFPHLRAQGEGGDGGAITARPKSAVVLLIYGARYKPEAYHSKMAIQQAKRKSTSGPRKNRGFHDSVEPVDEPEDEPDAEPIPGAAASSASGGLYSLFRR